jgi:hypothetical protein
VQFTLNFGHRWPMSVHVSHIKEVPMKKQLITACLALGGVSAHAINLDEEGRFQLTGFYELTAGKVLSGKAQGQDNWSYQGYQCPCAVQNWEYVKVYEKDKGWQLDQESLLGLQLNAKLTSSVSATMQVVSRPSSYNVGNYEPTIDWAYASWKVSEDWTLQAGRKRIPLYYYSDYLYIGYAYPWVRPSADVYGWPIFAYDGVTALYTRELGTTGWSMNASLWSGNFTDKDSAYMGKLYYGTKVEESWKRIQGGWVGVSNGVVELRLMHSMYQETTKSTATDGSVSVINDSVFSRVVGASLNVDYEAWLLRAELNKSSQRPNDPSKFVYNYYLLGGGYKVGQFTPMFTMSRYMTEPTTMAAQEGSLTRSASVRWDFMKNTALKLQYDDKKDLSRYSYPFFGDSKMLSVSLQGVF